MLIYDAVFVLLVASWLLTGSNKIVAVPVLSVWCLFLLVFIGLRDEVGCDFNSYLEIFNNAAGLPISELQKSSEFFFAVIFYVVHQIGHQYFLVNLIAASVFIGCSWEFARRQPEPLFALALMFPILIIHLAMAGIRQAAAVGVVMLAYIAFIEKKPLKYVVLTVFAGLFHTSAFLFIPLAILLFFDVSAFLLIPALAAIVLVLPSIGALGLTTYENRYVSQDVVSYGAVPRVGLILLSSLMFFLSARAWKAMFAVDYKLVHFGSCLAIAIFLLTLVSSTVGDRMAYYLIPIQIMIFTRLYHLQPDHLWASIYKFIPIFLLGGFQITWLATTFIASYCYLPYRNFIFE